MAKAPFPLTLHMILRAESPTIISWDVTGSSFRIIDHQTFCNQVLPRYFKHNKFTSFQRQLNFYSFQKSTDGPHSGSYFHPLFRRDHYSLIYQMKRTVRKNAASSDDERSNALSCSGPATGGPSPLPCMPGVPPLPPQLGLACVPPPVIPPQLDFFAGIYQHQPQFPLSSAPGTIPMNAPFTVLAPHQSVPNFTGAGGGGGGVVFPSTAFFSQPDQLAAAAKPLSSSHAGVAVESQTQIGRTRRRSGSTSSTEDRERARGPPGSHERSSGRAGQRARDDGEAGAASFPPATAPPPAPHQPSAPTNVVAPDVLKEAVNQFAAGVDEAAAAGISTSSRSDGLESEFVSVAEELIEEYGAHQSLSHVLALLGHQRLAPNPQSQPAAPAPETAPPSTSNAGHPSSSASSSVSSSVTSSSSSSSSSSSALASSTSAALPTSLTSSPGRSCSPKTFPQRPSSPSRAVNREDDFEHLMSGYGVHAAAVAPAPKRDDSPPPSSWIDHKATTPPAATPAQPPQVGEEPSQRL